MEITIHSLVTDHHIKSIKLLRDDITKMVDPDAKLGLRQAKEIADGLRDGSLALTLDVPEAFVPMVEAWLEARGFRTTAATRRTVFLSREVTYPDPHEYDPEPHYDYHEPPAYLDADIPF
jgi:hypothetical protein